MAVEAATLESMLLAGLTPEFREPQQRCELIAARFDSIDRQLSLYREELASLQIFADGTLIADSARALQLVAFESRVFGPGSATIVLDLRYASSTDQLRAGRRIEISFIDRAGRTHPLFCGIAAIVRTDPATQRLEAVALVPRAGTELQSSALYQNQSCVDVLKNLAATAGLAVKVTGQGAYSVFPEIVREKLATWPFMCQLARQCSLGIRLGRDGRLLISEDSFVPPPAPPSQTWINMTWVEVATSLAQRLGRAPDVRVTGDYPQASFQQTAGDEDFLLQISIGAQTSAWFAPGKLMIAEDGVWSTIPARRATPDDATDLLLKRVIVTGSATASRSFSRRISVPSGRAQDPERVPTEEVTMLLGRSMSAATLPAFALTDARLIAGTIEATLVRLGSQPASADRRFLQDLARHYRPTLHHLYRLRPDGARVLDAIGR